MNDDIVGFASLNPTRLNCSIVVGEALYAGYGDALMGKLRNIVVPLHMDVELYRAVSSGMITWMNPYPAK